LHALPRGHRNWWLRRMDKLALGSRFDETELLHELEQ
jgi:hypothetical protein